MKQGISLSLISQWLGFYLDHKASAFGACVDTRLLKPGDLFFACPGAHHDGHQFIENAAMKGAAAAIVAINYHESSYGLPLIKVEDPFKALQLLAKKYLAQQRAQVIAITGSMGKTTAKNFLTHLLSFSYSVASTPGNYNSQLGLPLTILNELSEENDFLILEMGMSKAGQIASLVQIAPPDIALLTGVALAHAENFDSLENIALAKAEIFSHPQTKYGLLSRETSYFNKIVQISSCPLYTFSCQDGHADFALLGREHQAALWEKGTRLGSFANLQLPGHHNYHNLLAACAAARICGMGWEAIKEAAKTLALPPLRLEIVERQGITFINDCYNALPIAVKAALECMPDPQPGGRKIAVLSEMRELGRFSKECHLEVARLALKHVDCLFCLGNDCLFMVEVWQRSQKPFFWHADLPKLRQALKNFIRPGDTVLIKGSRSSGFSEILDKLQN